MMHPAHDDLVLLAYGELPRARTREMESHLATCAICHAAFLRLERARVAVDWVAGADRPSVLRRLAYAGLATAAILAVVLLVPSGPPPAPTPPGWQPLTAWSPTAGYAAGGALVIDIDARLTRLEQERSYGFPN